MLSICIPVFNDDVTILVNALSDQAKKLNGPVEIILIDDGSEPAYKLQYPSLEAAGCVVRLLPENIGRSRIRNRFIPESRYTYLLFLDGDSQVTHPDFLLNYMAGIEKQWPVVCGGRVYPPVCPGRAFALHWKYGRKRESRSLADRKLEPSRSFMTNNFLIRKEVLASLQFDERLEGYGHEDTLFGYRLIEAAIMIKHIENPVLHGRLSTDKEFLFKTRSAVANLVKVLINVDEDPEFIRQVTLLSTYFRLRRSGITRLFYFLGPVLIPISYWLLKNGLTSLRLFNSYKLLLLSRMYPALRKQKGKAVKH